MHDIQKRILEQAKQEDISVYGYRKLGELVGVDHPQKVKWHLQKLLNDGHLYKQGDGSIAVRSEDKSSGRIANIPILGLANCGEPLAVADDTTHGYLTLSSTLIRSGKKLDSLFAVQATGDSMNNCSIDGKTIEDSDYVLVDSTKTVPENGDYVVSSLEGLANIKRYYRDEQNQLIALVSESTRSRPPIMIDPDDPNGYVIHGKVTQVIKSSGFSF